MTFDITMLSMGTGEVPGPEVFWMSRWDEWLPLRFQVALVRGDGIVALVNTGPAEDLEPMNAGWASFLGERARFVREPGEFIADQLERHSVAPSDVTHVILTPLQLYSISNLALFDRAEICLARRGWLHFQQTHEHPHDTRETSIPAQILAALVGDWWPRVRLLDDEDEIAPGLRTWWTGGHHRASLAVDVDVDATGGVACISDAFFYAENVTADHPIGISENIYESLAAYDRVRRTASLILPLYDPLTFERYPDGHITTGGPA